MNQRNVQALDAVLRTVAAGEPYLYLEGLADELASRGVLVPSTLTDDDMNLVYEYLEGIKRIPDEDEDESDELLPSSRGAVRALERIAKGETE